MATHSFTATLGDIVEATPALARLAKKELPLKMALDVARLYRRVVAEQRVFEETRVELVKRWGVPINGSDTFRVSPDHLAEFGRQLKEAAAIEITIDCRALSLAELQGIDGIQVAPEDLLLLAPLFDDSARVAEETQKDGHHA